MKDVRSGEHAVIAGIAVKWVVEEDGTREALVLRQKAKLIASDLLVDECANTFWKKVQRRELLKAEALLGTRSISMTQFSGLMRHDNTLHRPTG